MITAVSTSFQKHFFSIVYVIGEANAVLAEMMSPWLETKLSTVLSKYSIADFYHADRFGLFYQELPSKTMHFKKDKRVGGKFTKLRLSGLVPENALDPMLPIFVIGNANKPRSIKNLKQLAAAGVKKC